MEKNFQLCLFFEGRLSLMLRSSFFLIHLLFLFIYELFSRVLLYVLFLPNWLVILFHKVCYVLQAQSFTTALADTHESFLKPGKPSGSWQPQQLLGELLQCSSE